MTEERMQAGHLAGAPPSMAALVSRPFRIGDQAFVQDPEQEGPLRFLLSVFCVCFMSTVLLKRKKEPSRMTALQHVSKQPGCTSGCVSTMNSVKKAS